MKDVQERNGKLHSKMVMLEVNLDSEIKGKGIDQKHLLPISGSVRLEQEKQPPYTHRDDASPGGQNLDFSSKQAPGSRVSPQPLECENQQHLQLFLLLRITACNEEMQPSY